jgi:hypothetical protein
MGQPSRQGGILVTWPFVSTGDRPVVLRLNETVSQGVARACARRCAGDRPDFAKATSGRLTRRRHVRPKDRSVQYPVDYIPRLSRLFIASKAP